MQKILVIDDNVPSADTLMWALQAMGHDVRVAYNGVVALEKIIDFVPDVVLCDITMPRFNGYDICRRMRADARLAHTLFIAQTGLSSPQVSKLTADAGYHHHLVKPIDLKTLQMLMPASEAPLARTA